MIRILVLCTGNSCRSQIAEGYLRNFTQGRAEVYSAGVEAHGVNPRAVETMAEDGIGISAQTSNNFVEYLGIKFDYIITVCDHAREHCSVYSFKATHLHRNFPDPADVTGMEWEIRLAFSQVRDALKAYCLDFVRTHMESEPTL